MTDVDRKGLHRHGHRHSRADQGHNLWADNRTRNRLINALRASADRANALLKATWRALRRITLDPWRIGTITAAALVLLTLHKGNPVRKPHWPSTELPGYGLVARLGPAMRDVASASGVQGSGLSDIAPRRWFTTPKGARELPHLPITQRPEHLKQDLHRVDDRLAPELGQVDLADPAGRGG